MRASLILAPRMAGFGALRPPTFNTAMSGSRRIAAHSDTDYVRRNEREMVA